MIMTKALKINILLLALLPALHASADVKDTLRTISGRLIPLDGAFVGTLHDRDSMLIADQFLYGFELKEVEEGTVFTYPEWENGEEGGIMILSPWITDTLKVTRARKGMPRRYDIRGSVLMTSFDEGEYELPSIRLQRLSADGVVDTLVFDPLRVDINTIPIDTASFTPNDIKGQIRYPVTAAEVLPWAAGWWHGVLLVALVVGLLILRKSRMADADFRREPAHIVALRKLDKFRGNRMWAPERQKAFYSGVTDALREYIAARYDIGAMEMTTADIFEEMKATDAPADLLAELKSLFETADFVKFAKFTASDDDNARALPTAVRFVTSTYQSEIEDAAPLPSDAGPEEEDGMEQNPVEEISVNKEAKEEE